MGMIYVLQVGVKRAAFSNEAGVGTAPMAHSNAKTAEPVAEGLVAMLGPFLDTIVVCTMTALVILVSFPEGNIGDADGVALTGLAFSRSFPGFGQHILGLVVLLFSLTTIIGMANYNQKCWNFLFCGRRYFSEGTFKAFFCVSIMIGAMSSLHAVVNFIDICYGLMALPNMIATLLLAPQVIAAMKDYFSRLRLGEFSRDADQFATPCEVGGDPAR